jgi:hypothetical protein
MYPLYIYFSSGVNPGRSSDPVSRKITEDILREPNKEKGLAFSLGDRRTSPNS